MLISAFPVAAASIVIREFAEALITIGVELFRLCIIAVRVVDSPGPNEDCAVFWDEHSFVIVIWNDISLYTDINIRCFTNLLLSGVGHLLHPYKMLIDNLGRELKEKRAYAGLHLIPSLMIELIYGNSAKSFHTGVLLTPHTLSSCFCAFFCTSGCFAKARINVRRWEAVVSAPP